MSSASTPSYPPLVALGAVTSVEFIENGMVMFAAGQIAAGLQLSAQEFAFAYTLYGVGAILMLFKHRWMVERLGYRRFVLLSLACFGLGSLLCALAGGLAQFAGGRLLQGLGGATFFTAGRLAINDLPAESRRTGLVTFVASLLGASAIAPLLAVGLMELGQWRALFWFGVPQTLLVAWVAHGHLSRDLVPRAERSTEHWGWLLWLCVGVFCLQYAIQGIGLDAADPRGAALAAAASVLMLAVFARRQWGRERPLIDYRGLAQQRYLLGLAMYFIGYCLIGTSGLMVPVMLHTVAKLSLFETAAVSSCAMAGSVTVALLHLRLAQGRPRHRLFMLAGLALFGAGSLALASADARSAWPELLPAVLALYLAIPLFLGPVAAATFTELPGKAFSHGYQVKNIIRQLGLSSSIAVATVALHLFPRGQVFALMAAAVIPAGLAVLAQREFR